MVNNFNQWSGTSTGGAIGPPMHPLAPAIWGPMWSLRWTLNGTIIWGPWPRHSWSLTLVATDIWRPKPKLQSHNKVCIFESESSSCNLIKVNRGHVLLAQLKRTQTIQPNSCNSCVSIHLNARNLVERPKTSSFSLIEHILGPCQKVGREFNPWENSKLAEAWSQTFGKSPALAWVGLQSTKSALTTSKISLNSSFSPNLTPH